MRLKISFSLFLLLILISLSAFPLKAQENFGQILGAKNTASQNPGQQKKAIIGNVNEITTKNLRIQNNKYNTTTDTLLDNKTQIFGQGKKTLRLKDIKLQDRVAVISTDSAEATGGASVRKAVKVYIKSADTQTLKRQAIQGVITNLTATTITLAHQIHRDRVYQIAIDSTTAVTMKGVANATIANLAIAQRVVVIGSAKETGIYTATAIHIIPGKATGIFNKQPVVAPTSSLTVTPETSITPSLSVTPTGTISGTPGPTITNVPSLTPVLSPTVTPTIAVPALSPTPTTGL